MHLEIINNAIQRLEREIKYFDKSIIPDMNHEDPKPDENCNFILSVKHGGQVFINDSVKIGGAHVKIYAHGNGVILIGKNTVLKNCIFDLTDEGTFISIGDNCKLSNLNITTRRKNSIVVIGNDTTWESGAALNPHSKIISVGSDCMLSSSVVLRTGDGHSIFDAKTKERINNDMDVIVGNHVWLGNSTRINKGVVVGSGSVVGQMSIVSKDVEENSIYAGIPAKKIKDGIVWSRYEEYEKIPEEYRYVPEIVEK